jgi:hypothetical protein
MFGSRGCGLGCHVLSGSTKIAVEMTHLWVMRCGECGKLIGPRIFVFSSTPNRPKSAQIANKTGYLRSEQPDRSRP